MEKIKDFFICILLLVFIAPAAVIHLAYEQWYFKHYILPRACRKGKQSTKQSI